MSKEIVINSLGDTKRVRPLPETVISKPFYRRGFTTFSEYISAMKDASEVRRAENLWQEEITINIQTPYKWFGIQALADFHIGHEGVDYEALERILAGFYYHDNLRTILLGDLGDFFTPHAAPRDGWLGDVMPPGGQLNALRKFFTEFQDKILAVTNDPSHNDWVYRASGLDTYELLVEELDIPLVYQGGLIRLNFNEVSYDIVPFHKIAKFKSSFNLTHALKRADELHRSADCLMAAHVHKGAVEKTRRRGREIMLVQCGTLKLDDAWGKKQGYLGRPYEFYPVVLFNTQEKRMQAVTELEDAGELLKIKLAS